MRLRKTGTDARRIRDAIAALATRNGGDRSQLMLLVVGKSAGGVLAWNTFKRHYGELDDFRKTAIVLVDPHGSVTHDGEVGAYRDSQPLTWPSDWSTNQRLFRVYNIYQHQHGLTGASFPSGNVYRNVEITDDAVSHDSIPGREETRSMIREAIRFLFSSGRR